MGQLCRRPDVRQGGVAGFETVGIRRIVRGVSRLMWKMARDRLVGHALGHELLLLAQLSGTSLSRRDLPRSGGPGQWRRANCRMHVLWVIGMLDVSSTLLIGMGPRIGKVLVVGAGLVGMGICNMSTVHGWVAPRNGVGVLGRGPGWCVRRRRVSLCL